MSFFDYVMFDLDGTLLDSLKDIHESVNEALLEYGRKTVGISDTRKAVGHGLDFLLTSVLRVSFAIDQIKDDVQIKRFHEEKFSGLKNYYKKRYNENYKNNTKPYEGVREGLFALSREGVKSLIVTNKPEGFAKKILLEQDISDYFLDVIGEDSLPERKPSLLIWEKIKETHGFEKNRTLMVGDGFADYKFGRDVGCKICLARYGMTEREDVDSWGGDYYADMFSEVSELILKGRDPQTGLEI